MIDLIYRMSFISSYTCRLIAVAACGLMICVVLYEVIARYTLNAPTLWAFDLAWMLNGAIFMLGAAYTLRTHQHVIVDIFSNLMGNRLRDIIYGAFMLFVFIPAAILLVIASWEQTWIAYQRNELLPVSAWQAPIWPFRLCVSVGLTALILEALNQGLQSLVKDTSSEGETDAV